MREPIVSSWLLGYPNPGFLDQLQSGLPAFLQAITLRTQERAYSELMIKLVVSAFPVKEPRRQELSIQNTSSLGGQ